MDSGDFISGASVRVKGQLPQFKGVAISGADGVFSIMGLPPGDFDVTVSREGYFEERLRVTLAPRQGVIVQVRLSSRTEAVQTITVEVLESLSSTDPGLAQTSISMSRREIESVPQIHKTDIPQLMARLVPGAVQGHDNLVHLKGNEFSLHQFVDGISFLDNPHSHFSAGYDPQVIESLNVITGGMPAEFGNRLGGVLDIVTKNGRTFQGGSLTVGGGTMITRNAAFEYGFGRDQWDAYLFSSGSSDGRYLNPPQAREIHDLGYGTRHLLKLGYQPTAKDRLSLMLSGGGTNFQLPLTSEELEVGRNSSRRVRQNSVVLHWARTISPRALVNTSLYHRYVSDRLIPTTDLLTPFAQAFRRTMTQGVKVDALLHKSGHLIKSGVDLAIFSPNEDLLFDPRKPEVAAARTLSRFWINEASPRALQGSFNPTFSFRGVEVEALRFRGRQRGGEGSIYIQDRFSPFPHFTVHAGLRYDRYSLAVTDDLLSPRIGLSYHLSQTGTVFRAVYNRYFVPPPLEYVLLSSAFGTGAVGGEHHAEETIDEPAEEERVGPVRSLTQHYFELGFQQPLRQNVSLDVSAYHHQGRNAYENVELSNARVFLPTTFGGERTWGSDVSLRLRSLGDLGLFGYLNYSYAISNFIGPVTGGLASEAGIRGQKITPAFDQRHTGSASLSYRHQPTGFRLGWGVGYGSGTPAEVEAEHGNEVAHEASFGLPGGAFSSGADEAGEEVLIRLPSYWTFDVWTGITLWKAESGSLDLEFNVENVGNRIYEIAKESEATPIQYGRPRRFYGQLKFRF